MSAKIHGLELNELRPTHDLELTRSSEGLWTGSQTYHCRFTDYSNAPVFSKLQQGTPITNLDPSIPIKWAFITLDTHRFTHQRGGITKINCTFKGSTDGDEFTFDNDKSESYSYRGVTTQDSILNHPNFLDEVSTTAQRAIGAFYRGEAYIIDDGSGGITIRGKKKDYDYFVGTLTANEVKWLNKIERGIRTFERPEVEWTVTTSNKGGITQTDLNEFGRKLTGTPPGDPPIPSWATGATAIDGDIGWWHYSDLTEDKDENSSTYSRTYTLRADPLDSDIFDF